MKKRTEMAEFKIGIQKIKELSFFVNESLGKDCTQAEMNVQAKLHFDMSSDSLIFQIAITYANDQKQLFASVETLNHFLLDNMAQFQSAKEPDKLDIPEDVLVLVLSISYSHTRALLASHLNGTAMEQFILPIINPGQLLKQLNLGITKIESNTKEWASIDSF